MCFIPFVSLSFKEANSHNFFYGNLNISSIIVTLILYKFLQEMGQKVKKLLIIGASGLVGKALALIE